MSTLFVIVVAFVIINAAILILSTTDLLQGWKTRITGLAIAVVAFLEAKLPESMHDIISEQNLAYVMIGLGLTSIVAYSVRQK